MAFLVLDDDEIALLRYTCDLYFVEESPLHYLEEERRAPRDYEESYRSLIKKQALDPRGFRVTDEALNRLAPVTECDARVVVVSTEDGSPRQSDFYLLDEIAVQYVHGDGGHALGPDLDQDELVEFLARRMVPRRAKGPLFEVSLTSLEYAAFALLLRKAKTDPDAAALRVPKRLIDSLLGPAPQDQAHRSPSGLMHMLNVRRAGARTRPVRAGSAKLSADPLWDQALRGLVDKGVLFDEPKALKLRPLLVDFARAHERLERTTFVRYDFGDGEWLMRETTFVPCEGSLFCLASDAERRLRLFELDSAGLRRALVAAVGSLRPKPVDVEETQTLGLPALPAESEHDDTEVALTIPTMTKH